MAVALKRRSLVFFIVVIGVVALLLSLYAFLEFYVSEELRSYFFYAVRQALALPFLLAR